MKIFCLFPILIFILTALVYLISPKTTIACNKDCTSISPHHLPLDDNEYTITAYFFDPNYFKIFHYNHTGVDLIPNLNWYKAHPNTSNILLRSTISGKFLNYYSSCGGKAAIVYNKEYLIYLGHISQSLKQDNDNVNAGDPIAYMGSTGTCITGEHVHYEIHKLIDNRWQLANPLDYK